MTMLNEEVKVNANKTHGNATVVGTEKGWALPGRKHTNCPRYAKMMAIRMSNLMTKLPESIADRASERQMESESKQKVDDYIAKARGES